MKGTCGREGHQRLSQPPTHSLRYILMLPGMISFNFAFNEHTLGIGGPQRDRAVTLFSYIIASRLGLDHHYIPRYLEP